MVKKPRANRSAAPRKPVIIEAEAKPVEASKTEPARAAQAAVPDGKTPPTDKAVSTTPKTVRKEVSTDAVKPPVSKEAPKPPMKQEDKPAPAKVEAPKKDDTSKPNDAKPSSPKADVGSNGGGGSVKGGVIGAVIAMLGAVGLNYAGILPGGSGSSDGADLAALETKFETKIDALSNSTAAAAPEFDPSTVQPLIDAALAKQSAALQTEIDQLKAALSAAETGTGNSAGAEQLAALEQQVKDLQSALSSGSAGENEGMTVLAGRVDAVEGGLNDIQENMSSLGKSVSATIPEDVTNTLSSVQETIAQNSDTLSTLTSALATNKEEAMTAIAALSEDVSAKISGLSDDVDALSAQAADTSRQTDVAGAIATAGLKAAIDRGGPFMAELETYAQIAPESAIIDQLRPLAARGVPTQSDLLKQFDSVAYDMIAAADAPAEGEGGMLSGLMSSAKSLVKVRPVGSVEGDDAGAITARMGEALKASNYAGVEAEFATLPEAAKTAGAGFIKSLQARQQADTLIRDVLSQALQASSPNAAQTAN